MFRYYFPHCDYLHSFYDSLLLFYTMKNFYFHQTYISNYRFFVCTSFNHLQIAFFGIHCMRKRIKTFKVITGKIIRLPKALARTHAKKTWCESVENCRSLSIRNKDEVRSLMNSSLYALDVIAIVTKITCIRRKCFLPTCRFNFSMRLPVPPLFCS